MIKLNDILKLDNLDKFKVRLNMTISSSTTNKTPAIDVYINEPKIYTLACAWNGQYKSLNRPFLITFAHIKEKENLWLFTGIYNIVDYDKYSVKTSNCVVERAKLIENPNFKQFCGRLVVKYHKKTQAYVLNAENIIDSLEVNQILDSEYNNEYFKGYENVNISFKQLKHIVNTQNESWKSALENSKGIYLITDKNNGKMYVGSAYGENMLWRRWKDYIKTGHGGNKNLKNLVKTLGLQYVEDNFNFTILEHFTSSIEDKKVIARENHWKEVLLSRKFGYNDN